MANKKIVVAAFSLIFASLLFVAYGKDAAKTGKAISLTGHPAAGQKIYNLNCRSCHGNAGAGGVANPGSDDGTVPELAPIDMDLRSASAIDLVIEHGSEPEGKNPAKIMPAFGDTGILKPQQIADVISYILSLNK